LPDVVVAAQTTADVVAAVAVARSWSPEDSDQLDAIRSQHDPAGMFPFGRHGT
jgi:hypothetical protein